MIILDTPCQLCGDYGYPCRCETETKERDERWWAEQRAEVAALKEEIDRLRLALSNANDDAEKQRRLVKNAETGLTRVDEIACTMLAAYTLTSDERQVMLYALESAVTHRVVRPDQQHALETALQKLKNSP